MSDSESVPLREILNKVSTNVDELTRLMHTHIERMVNQQDGMKRLGEKVDTVEREKREDVSALEKRIHLLELSDAASGPENKSTSDWVRMAIVIVVTVVLTTGLNQMLDKQQVQAQGAGNAKVSGTP